MPEVEGDRLKKMNRRLYDRNRAPLRMRRSEFSQNSEDIKTNWSAPPQKKKRFNLSGLQIALIAAIIFFIGAVAFSVFSFQTGKNVVSPENVEILVKGPVSIKGGEELTLQLEITNKNPVTLQNVDMSVSFPPGTRSAENIDEEEIRYRNYLDTIDSGETIKDTVRAVLFGDENEEKQIVIRLEYRIEGSSATVPVVKNYNVVLTSAPVSVSLSAPEETNNEKEITLEVNVSSNSSQLIEDVFLEMDIPTGFNIISSEPESVFGKNLWSLGDLPAGISRTVKIRGIIEGEDNESKTFVATAGLRRDANDRGVSIPYNSDRETIVIKPAFVSLDILLNGVIDDVYIASPGSDIRGVLKWANRLPAEVRNGTLDLEFSGPILDRNSVTVLRGFYRSTDDTIIWRPQDISSLGSLSSGESSETDFDFGFISSNQIESLGLSNPTLDLIATFEGERTSDSFGGQSIKATANARIKLQSSLRLLAQGSYSGGIFSNTGPIPPRVGQETTYTITWSVTNTFNNVEDVEVVGVLPTYVKWLNITSDPSQNITYNDSNGEIKWKVGDINSGLGTRFPAREVSFQVGLIPSLSQVGESVELINSSSVKGVDSFTQTTISGSSRAVTTGSVIDTGSQGRVTN